LDDEDRVVAIGLAVILDEVIGPVQASLRRAIDHMIESGVKPHKKWQ
jgi:hypothetical protein